MSPETVLLLGSGVLNLILMGSNILIALRKFPSERSQMQAEASVDYAAATQSWINTVFDLNQKLQKRSDELYDVKRENATLKDQMQHALAELAELREEVNTLKAA